ncbi:MAG: HD-GYP domain-containing protein [Candidatus Eisenbacteria bacterium]|nr:HD-GYP domain-containing protein [Candidatus Eisenbacteria bacterium]
MTDPKRDDFAGFIREGCADLFSRLSEAVDVPLAVLDADGDVILSFPRGGAGTPAAAGAPGSVATIDGGEGTLGSVVTRENRKRLAPFLDSLAGVVGERYGLEREIQRMTDDLAQSYDQVDLLYRFARVIRPNDSFEGNARRLLEETADILENRLLVQYFPREDVLSWSAGPGLILPECLLWLTDNPNVLKKIYADLARDVKPGDAERNVRFRNLVDSPYGRVEYVLIPLWVQSEVAGYAGLFRTLSESELETGEIRLLEGLVAELSNTATTRELYMELRQLLFNVVRSLVNTIEAKDEYTRGHSERVFRISLLIGNRLGFPAPRIQDLSWAALLHDVGKIAINDKVLLKPGRLTDEEYEIVKTHPGAGVRMLEPIAQLSNILPGIRHHHERYDGRGYPDGLAGEKIPLDGRIIAVADTYDAITTARPYRPAGSHEKAVDIIRSVAGTQLDPEMVRVFLELAADGAVESPEPGGAQPVPIGGIHEG